MKKNFKWLINIAAIALCVCAMAIGIYAAKQASLTATGTIGFTAHDCAVKVSGTIDAYKNDFTTKLDTTSESEGKIKETIVTEEGQTLPLPAQMYFSDLTDGGDVITITLTITNQSAYTVLCNIPNPVAYDSTATTEITAVKGLTSAQSFTLAKDGTKTITITFTLSDIENAADINAKFSANLEFKKYTFDRSVLKIADTANATTGLDVGNLYVEMGEYNSTPLKWYAFGYSSTGSDEVGTTGMQAITASYAGKDVTSATDIPAGTYFFVSEYALGTSAFNSSMSGVLDDVQYNGSDLQTSINSLATSSTYKIGTSTLYSQITARTLSGEKPNYMYDEDDNSITDIPTTNSSTNQTLWALSYDEANTLANAKTADLTAGGTSACSWWLRSPGICYANYGHSVARYVYSDGGVGPADREYGVRAAFKLVIA